MEKLIVHRPFVYKGVNYHQGMEFRPSNEEDARAKERTGEVRRKNFGKPAQKAPAPNRKLETRNAESKLAEQTVEKTAEPDPESQEEESEEEKTEDKKPARRGRPRRTLSSKKDD